MTSHIFKFVSTLIFSLFLMIALQIAYAEEQRIVEKITSTEMKTLLNGEGFIDVTIDNDGDLIVKMNGLRVLVIIRENNNSNIKYVFATKGTSATLRTVNDWNREKKYSSAYIDDQGDPVMKMDVDLAGGITIARIRDSIRTFSQLQIAFVKTLVK